MKKPFLFLVLIFLINIPGLYYQWYLSYWWFDVILHFFGGFFVAMFFSTYLKDHLFDHSKIKNTLIILGVVSLIGVTWEFAEYVANVVLSPIIYNLFTVKTYFMGNLNDTINDLMMDIIGAGTFYIFSGIERPIRPKQIFKTMWAPRASRRRAD